MCFHASLTKEEKAIEKRFKIAAESLDGYKPYYHFNGFEQKHLYIIKQNEDDVLTPSYWGLMPEDSNIYGRTGFLKKTNTLNARAERLFDSPLFKTPTFENRCLILADGFFEPHSRDNKSFPHYIRYKNKELFAFAGIYTELYDDLYTASIITTLANPFFKEIHNKKNRLGEYRMPLVLDEKDEFEWLNTNLNEAQIRELLFTFTSEEFEAYPVSKDVFKKDVVSDRANILQEVNYDELNTLF
jgi:putative SOS response-associated peptidase YedK